jgi:hypothetical protein
VTFGRKPYPRQPKPPLVLRSEPVRATMGRVDRAPVQALKTPDRVSQAIRDSARGEECTVRIPGVCTFDPEKTIWSHAPLGAAGKGRGIKALDLCGAYCCTACDAALDRQATLPAGLTRAEVLIDWFYGHMRSLVRLRQKGLT